MKIPIVWLSLHPGEIAARGYWDQAFLEDMFSSPLYGLDISVFEHVTLIGPDNLADFPESHTGILVLPARHHTSPADQRQIHALLWRWSHPVVFLTGDEESAFPVHRLFRHPNIKVWVQTPSTRYRGTHVRRFGDGYAPGSREALPWVPPDKPVVFTFAGQITHQIRQEAYAAMMSLPYPGKIIATEGFTQGVPRDEYMALLSSAKLAPAPSGPCTPDTFRLFEALEAGCLPIADTPPYWQYLFGTTPAFPVLDSWSQLPEIAESALASWPAPASRASAFYQQHKRTLGHQFRADIAQSATSPVTVIIPTSPIPSHPSTDIIEATLASIVTRLPDAEILILCDGIRSEQQHRRADYEEYLYRLAYLCNTRWPNATPFIFDAHLHQSGLTHAALPEVQTPLILFVEHDCPLVGDIPFSDLYQPVLSGVANVIRLHHEATVLEPHRHLMLDDSPQNLFGVPLLRTIQWSQRPHLASTDFYRWLLSTYFPPESRTMIEDVLHGPVQVEHNVGGIAGWEKFRLFMYAPSPTDMKRSTTTDGRREDPKFDMHIVAPPQRPLGFPSV